MKLFNNMDLEAIRQRRDYGILRRPTVRSWAKDQFSLGLDHRTMDRLEKLLHERILRIAHRAMSCGRAKFTPRDF